VPPAYFCWASASTWARTATQSVPLDPDREHCVLSLEGVLTRAALAMILLGDEVNGAFSQSSPPH
jgi:hypothetical protein